ncbi:MAG: 23S rRNA (adenine(2503)-C(2))-methyltransferase RlmN [Bacillota bacterium]|nr:23S rRNA (adenine(2503)-C(2))-methyltransferase RlmN [Bacillota bacterium]
MNTLNRTELLGRSIDELENFMESIGEKKFRARQIHKWIYQKETHSFYDMTDLPKDLRAKLDEKVVVSIPRVLKQRVSMDGTRKYLMELRDRKRIETVVIPQSKEKDTNYSLCISTQVGCPVGCRFCATGASGFQRNLQAMEIAGQVLSSRRELAKKVKTIDGPLINSVVYMGMGEPLLNYDETLKSIYMLNDYQGMNIGQRHLTVSTSGEAKGIHKLAKEDLQITLAISLHATENDLRDELIPMNKKYPLEVLMDAVESYAGMTNRRVTFEYIMLDDVNISTSDAKRMIKMIKPLLANVNLIPYNEVEGLPFKKPSQTSIRAFYNKLVDGGLNVTLREEHGSDIEAACGQLAANKER